MIKSNLGLNARQVTVSKSSSIQYLRVTIRDAAVDIKAVKSFAKALDTWTMDQTDYCEGQSVHVDTTREVDDAHASPFIAEIERLVPQLSEYGGVKLSTGAVLWGYDRDFYVSREGSRGPNVWAPEVRAGKDWAIRSLALQAARI